MIWGKEILNVKRVTTKKAESHISKIFCCPMKALYSKISNTARFSVDNTGRNPNRICKFQKI